ncbi:glycosyl transferase family 2 [Roseimicrobium gellanilyticum]|uniref:Glycosyl transferase family 2 n=1 Tax=Roseimicrobium gellanilyticum TaxID=748857 RepID=A0A366H3U8_9BACT|nr:glycosyltransferase family A protein [Roseimicrobium gellanilyticum]RBP36662.1 glycosyl transferase family 2 [Roseimicrobium gellanilyticum]
MEKFTVIIPAKDRCETLSHTLEACLAHQDANFELLVSDNYSSDATPQLLEEFKARDARLRCIQPPQPLSMAAHFEYVLGQVTEGFVMILGSDDAILPSAVKRARECLAQHPTAEVLHGVPYMFFYPDFYSEDAGLIFAHLYPRQEIRSSREWLQKALNSECGAADMPMPYQMAWVHTRVFARIKQRTGSYIHSCFPDYSLAITVAATTESYVHVSPGYGVSGISGKSNGLSCSYPKASRAIESSFLTENEITTHPKLKHTRSLFVVLGDAMLRAQEARLLPEGASIAWEKVLPRACVQFYTEAWEPEQLRENIASMRTIADNFGVPKSLDGMGDSKESVRSWASQLPFLNDWHHDEWEAVLDGRLIGVRGVHEAARVIEAMLATSEAAKQEFNAANASEEDFLAWGILQQAKQAATLRKQLRDLNHESERRAAERDRAKTQLAGVRAKNEKLKAKTKEREEASKTSWLPKWLRGR